MSKRILALENNDNLKDRAKWEKFIYDEIKNHLIPDKQDEWFLNCYGRLQLYITYCRPSFNAYYEAFYNVFADMVNNGEIEFNKGLLLSFSHH